MKNFFKKLSFVLAIAMVLTSVVPATTASAASKVQIELNGKAVTEVTAFFGGVVRNLDASKNGKAASGTWKVGNTKVATVDSKTGVITPVGEGTTKVAFTLKGEKKASASVYVKVRTRAAALHVYDPSEYATGTRNKLEDTTIELNVGEDKELKVTMPISKKASNAGAKISTYFLYAESSDEDVVKVSASTKMYTRAVTLKPVAAGEATVTLFANQTTKANARANKYVKEAKFTVKVNDAENADIKVEATHAKTLEVTLGKAPAADVKVSVKRGTTTVDNTYVVKDNKVIITTAAKMIAGTYTVTVGELEASVDVDEQDIAEIIVHNENSYVGTNAAGTVVYVYYDVLDQYGDSMLNMVTVEKNPSLNRVAAESDDSIGKLALENATAGTTINYGTSVYITFVAKNRNTVKTKSAEVKVGLASKLNSLDIKGIVKKNTSKLTTLPVDANKLVSAGKPQYFVAFTGTDQYGEPVDLRTPATWTSAISVSSKNPLIADSAFNSANADTFGTTTIGEANCGMFAIKAGYNYKKGAEVEFDIVATGTGYRTSYVLKVEEDQILTTFEIGLPGDIVTEGRTVELPFTALDQNGAEISSYRVLNGNVKLSSSIGSLWLEETDDAKAKLFFAAPTNTNATKDVDQYVTVTAVVTEKGGVDSQSFYIKDQAYPAAVAGVSASTTILEGDSVKVFKTFAMSGFGANGGWLTYVDQYGRALNEFDFGVQMNEVNAYMAANEIIATSYVDGTRLALGNTVTSASNAAITINALANDTATATVSGLVEFKINTTTAASTAKMINFSVVDISKVVSFTTALSGKLYYSAAVAPTGKTVNEYAHAKAVKVTGKLSDGTEVNVPHYYGLNASGAAVTYYDVATYSCADNKDLFVDNSNVVVGEAVASKLPVIYFSSAPVTANDFVQNDTNNNRYEDEKLGVIVTVNDVNQGTQKDKLNVVLDVSNLEPVPTTLKAASSVVDGKATVNAIAGEANVDFTARDSKLTNFVDSKVYDQYGVQIGTASNCKITVSKVVESEDGIYEGSIVLTSNGTSSVVVSGLERQDTFAATYALNYTTSTGAKDFDLITINFTVGADQDAWFGSNFDGPSVWY